MNAPIRHLNPILMLATLTASTASAATLYVDIDAIGSESGLNWTDAYSSLSAAIDAAVPGDSIWVADGVYFPETTASGSKTFELKSNVGIYGGFAGTESSLAQRNFAVNVTTLSGDGPIGIDPAIVVGSGVDSTAILDGFTITDGASPDDATAGVGGAGGGVFIDTGSPTINNCNIVGNTARLGAGVYVVDGSPTFTGCTISNAGARSSEGGGIYATRTTAGPNETLTLIQCEVSANFVWQGHFATAHGAGVYCNTGYDLVVTGCSMSNNFCSHNGTFGQATSGGAIEFHGGTAVVTDSYFSENIAAFGAGIYSTGGSLTCVNCVFIGNRAVAVGCGGPECNGAPDVLSGFGGGVWSSNANLINCTFNANWAAKLAGGAAINGTVTNCIFWGNRIPPVCCGEDPIPVVKSQLDGAVSISFSCVEGLLDQIPGENPPDPANVPGSIAVDPLFAAPYQVSATFGWLTALGDERLSLGSPCVDAGDNSAVPAGITTDYVGADRFFDEPGTPDLGNGFAPVVDMGAHEFGAPFTASCPADINGDGVVDTADLGVLIGAFGTGDAAADINNDGTVDTADLGLFIGAFGVPCG